MTEPVTQAGDALASVAQSSQRAGQIAAISEATRWSRRGLLAVGGWLLLAAGLTVAFAGAFAAMWKYHWFPAWGRTDLSLYGRLTEGDS